MDPFTRAITTRQGRVQPENWIPADGDWCFVLGSDIPGEEFPLVVGDYSEVEQTADFGSTATLHFSGRIRGPSVMPVPNAHWELAIRIDGAERAMRRVVPGHTVDLGFMAICVVDLAPGNHSLAFRLSLVAGA